MPDQTPLNEEALEDAADLIWMRANGEHGVCRADRERGSYRNAMDAATEAVAAYLSALPATQPVVTSVESFPAKMRMLMWEGGEFEVGEIPEGHVLVGFEMATDRAWSMADKVTIHIERPEES